MLTSEARARTTDPETSHAAAASVGDLRLSQSAVHQLIAAFGPMSDERLCHFYEVFQEAWGLPPQSASGIRSRRAELVRLGLVQFNGDKALMKSGRMARVWAIARD